MIRMYSAIFAILASLYYSMPALAAEKETQTQIQELNKQIQTAAEKGDLQAAITASEEAYTLAQKEYGVESVEAAKAMNNMANLYMYAGHPQDAERMYKDSILIEVMRDPDSITLADSYFNLAMAYAMQKKYEPAEGVLARAIAIRTQKLGADHVDTVKARNALHEVRRSIPSEKIT